MQYLSLVAANWITPPSDLDDNVVKKHLCQTNCVSTLPGDDCEKAAIACSIKVSFNQHSI